MKKLLIVDDEPLVLVGMQSMLDYKSLGIEICGTAKNGEQALALIEELKPEIVISDIKMPVMDGLTLISTCQEKGYNLPLFILLTSYEDFGYAKKALQLNVVDYLVKLDLSVQNLTVALKQAIEQVDKMLLVQNSEAISTDNNHILLEEKFFSRLYGNLFRSSEAFEQQVELLGLDFSYPLYNVATCRIERTKATAEQDLALNANIIKLVKTAVEKFCKCTITSIGVYTFNILFYLDENEKSDYDFLQTVMSAAMESVKVYFGTQIYCVLGEFTTNPQEIGVSAYYAYNLLSSTTDKTPILLNEKNTLNNEYNFSFVCKTLSTAFEELDADEIHRQISNIIEQFSQNPMLTAECRDFSLGLLYLILSGLQDAESFLGDIFKNEIDSYKCVYRYNSVSQYCEYLEKLREGLYSYFKIEQTNSKKILVAEIVSYIKQNITKPLSLNETANIFNYSPSYLSRLFSSFTSAGFVETVTKEKINVAKAMLLKNEMKVFEVSDYLGYKSPYYFSKVFKKETGYSPRDFVIQKTQEEI